MVCIYGWHCIVPWLEFRGPCIARQGYLCFDYWILCSWETLILCSVNFQQAIVIYQSFKKCNSFIERETIKYFLIYAMRNVHGVILHPENPFIGIDLILQIVWPL